jgi:hypothetical protein
MSEKRHRQQQRRQRRKTRSRPRTSGAAHGGRTSFDRQAAVEVGELLADMAEIASRDAHGPTTALDAEQWASCLIGTFHVRPMPGEDVEAMFLPRFVDALEALGTAPALPTLRALTAVAAPHHARLARAAGDRLALSGMAEPPWVEGLGRHRPTAAALMSEEAFDDGVSVMVEFSAPGAEPHTLGIYVDHNMGGLVKDVVLAGPLDEVRAQFNRRGPDGVGLSIRELDLAEARARVEAALYMLDHTLDPPVSEDVRLMRALIGARMRLLPEGFELPDDHGELTLEERDALLADFLGAPEGRRWRGDEDAEDIAHLAIEFGADYNHGGALRWSPVVVEIFMTDWLARKVTRETDFFARVSDVLRDWVTYAGRRRRVPAAPLREAVAAVDHYREDMLDTVNDAEAWGPAKALAVAALDAGVDLTDRDQVERFVQRYNDGLAA